MKNPIVVAVYAIIRNVAGPRREIPPESSLMPRQADIDDFLHGGRVLRLVRGAKRACKDAEAGYKVCEVTHLALLYEREMRFIRASFYSYKTARQSASEDYFRLPMFSSLDRRAV
jgi:hypothetical protein